MSFSAFGENLTVHPIPVAGWSFAYNVNADLVTSTTANGGTVTGSNGRARLQTSTASNGSAEIVTKRVLRYTPGHGGLARFTGVWASGGKKNSTQIIGIGDSDDGFFFGYNGETFSILVRSNGSDEWIEESEWNIFPMLSSNVLGLNPTVGNIFQIRYQWLGYGAIRFYVEEPESGEFLEVHRIKYANTDANTSIRNPTLPLMAQVVNDGNTDNLDFYTPSGMLFVEGIIPDMALHPLTLVRPFAGSVSGDISTETPVLSIQAASTFQSITSRVYSQLGLFGAATDGTKSVTIRLYKGGSLTGESFSVFNANTSTLSSDTSASAISGGTLLLTFPLAKEDGRTLNLEFLGLEITPGETITLTAESVANSDVSIDVTMFERF